MTYKKYTKKKLMSDLKKINKKKKLSARLENMQKKRKKICYSKKK